MALVPNRRQAIIWTNADPIHWRIYAALGGDELKNNSMNVLSIMKQQLLEFPHINAKSHTYNKYHID